MVVDDVMKRSDALIQTVGHAVCRRRKALGLSQVQFARLCGFSSIHLGKIERAQVQASVSTLDSLARGFGMKMSELFELVEAAPGESNLPLHVHDHNLGRFVRRRREELGLSQAELGRLSGLSVKHLDHIERARVEASVNALERLARGLRMEASELIQMVDESPREADAPLHFRDWVRLKEDLEKLAIYVDWMVEQGPSQLESSHL